MKARTSSIHSSSIITRPRMVPIPGCAGNRFSSVLAVESCETCCNDNLCKSALSADNLACGFITFMRSTD